MLYCTGGWVDGDHLTPSIFFNFRYIKHYTHMFTNIYLKVVPTIFLWVKNLGQVGVPNVENQKPEVQDFLIFIVKVHSTHIEKTV